MQIFYTTHIEGDTAELPEGEARHCMQVLRHRPGDEVHFIDGRGGFYTGKIVEGGKKRCRLHILQRDYGRGERPYRLHLAVAPTKPMNRMEWLLEKATELGFDTFTPLLCQHSERRALKTERLEKVVLAAAKQSVKPKLPELRELQSFPGFLAGLQPEEEVLMAYLGEGVKGSLKHNYQPGRDVCLMVGPEGGFSPQEAAAAAEAGVTLVSLGHSRLRTETAALAACHAIHLINEL